MKRVFLVRHGEYTNQLGILPGRLPVELSENGISQIEKVRDYLNRFDIKKIYSSPVLRSKQTSEIISENNIPIIYDKRLMEVFTAYQGYWEINYINTYGHRSELGGESQEEVLARMVEFFDEALKNSDGNFVISSHGDPLYFLYLHLANKNLAPEDEPRDIMPGYLKMGEFMEVVIEDDGSISIPTNLKK